MSNRFYCRLMALKANPFVYRRLQPLRPDLTLSMTHNWDSLRPTRWTLKTMKTRPECFAHNVCSIGLGVVIVSVSGTDCSHRVCEEKSMELD